MTDLINSSTVIFENEDLLILYKAPGIPSIPDKTGSESLLSQASAEKKTDLFPINRIDRPAAGIIIFAKNKKSAAYYSELITSDKIEKTYLAFVQTEPPKTKVLTHYLKQDPHKNKAQVKIKAEKGFKKSELKLNLIGSSTHYHLLSIKIKTGRFHQIRAQLAAEKYPIKGDVKYGARRKNNDRSIHLLAYKLRIFLKGEKEARIFTSPFPEDSLWDFAKNLIQHDGQ